MTTPAELTLTYDLACEFLSFLRVGVDTRVNDLNLLCLQGVTAGEDGKLRLNRNTPDRYNDTVALVYKTEDMKKAEPLLGTLDPGAYYTQHSTKGGAAHLTFGQHLYSKGFHRGHPALRSLNEVNRFWRDKNGNFKPDIGEAILESKVGLNIHAGGKTKYIGRWSAGCINIAGGYDGEAYKGFITRIDAHSKKPVRVTAWRGVDLFLFAIHGWSYRPTLVMGMKNGWVVDLQRLLKEHKVSTTVDGDWRGQTSKAVVAFQRRAGLTPDGWVGGKTWEALT